ncbi:MAG: molecular chaperone HtpG [Mollicutes bacterium]|nr:molecular chaperone HtpG [Mollicutes bacterium]MDY3761376.1 molecular chaperone HtpG [Candidatus Onthovivens sp.]MCI7632688.1 molecular chaperone HtpG [Mollicutes bacterium]MCI7797445.1 molecular chaperone HtpG [Mollicutes bacterium]MDY3994147.1 molecular chaperone HtpG [Candidatus Onthovivens sp.]
MIETKEFQTESKQLLNLMINSIYTNKEIFLRELISNASDAIDKYKYLQLTSEGKLNVKDYQIYLVVDKQNRTLTIKDNGIGMSHDDLVNSLGTIASSGSKEFLKKYKEAKDSEDLNIIGQFGVGFYSAFMVASKIEVLTKTVDDKAYKFSSDGVKEYTIEEATKEDTGTEITLYLKEDKDDENYSTFLEYYTLEDLVKKYSDYIRYPIKLDEVIRTPKKDEKGEEIKDEYDEKVETKILNSMVPLWKKNKKDVTDEELEKFYKDKFSDYEKPFTSLFLNVDGIVKYNALIFIPSHAPYNLYSENYEKGLDLYSKGIFVKEKCKELVPDYLKFIKGLVDSDDFDLNISREMLQSSPLLRRIEDNIEKKILEKLKEIKNNDYNKYLDFFKTFGDHFKYAIYQSYGAKKEQLQDLLVFNSLLSETPISLKDYVSKMKEDQKYIYYASGKSLDYIKMLPQIEKFKKDGIEVLLLDKKIDEFAIMMMRDYDKKEFKNVADEASNELSKEEKDNLDTLIAENKRILDDIKEGLNGKVDEVTFSTKLVDSPVCITTKNGLSLNMENTLNEEARENNFTDDVKATKVLEINPHHELFKAIEAIKDSDDEVKLYGSILYDEALMLEGYEVEDKKEFIEKLNKLMIKSLK